MSAGHFGGPGGRHRIRFGGAHGCQRDAGVDERPHPDFGFERTAVSRVQGGLVRMTDKDEGT